MGKSRRVFSSEFKHRVAVEAIREQETLASLSQRYNVHPNQIQTWKAQLLEGGAAIFTDKRSKESTDKAKIIADLHRKIGEITVENDFLEKVLGR